MNFSTKDLQNTKTFNTLDETTNAHYSWWFSQSKNPSFNHTIQTSIQLPSMINQEIPVVTTNENFNKSTIKLG